MVELRGQVHMVESDQSLLGEMSVIAEPLLFIFALVDTGAILFILVYFVSFHFQFAKYGCIWSRAAQVRCASAYVHSTRDDNAARSAYCSFSYTILS